MELTAARCRPAPEQSTNQIFMFYWFMGDLDVQHTYQTLNKQINTNYPVNSWVMSKHVLCEIAVTLTSGEHLDQIWRNRLEAFWDRTDGWSADGLKTESLQLSAAQTHEKISDMNFAFHDCHSITIRLTGEIFRACRCDSASNTDTKLYFLLNISLSTYC